MTTSNPPLRELTCCCCGELTIGRQWWNRDKGYGHCDACTLRYDKETKEFEENECFGIKGYHYFIKNVECLNDAQ